MRSFRRENKTLYLPGLHLETRRRTPRSARQILADKTADIKQKTFGQLSQCFTKFIPRQHLQPAQSGALSRRRFFSKENTFWAFFLKCLMPMVAVRKWFESYRPSLPCSLKHCRHHQPLAIARLAKILMGLYNLQS